MNRPIRILLVDEHVLVREALAQWLRSAPGFEVVCAAGVDEAAAQALTLQPDVLLVDADGAGPGAFEAAAAIRSRCPRTRLVVLAAAAHDRSIARARQAGACAYVLKREAPDALVRAVRQAAAGQTYYSGEVAARIDAANPPQPRPSALTNRELEILRHLASGLTKKEIARLLHISVNTVNRHSDNLMAKLDIHDRVRLARYAMAEGLVEAGAL